ncbi:LysR substrate-binding domain-containing protein, partial [Thiolapillus sp.]
SEAYFVFPLAQGTPGKQCGLAATGDYQPSLRSPWLAADEWRFVFDGRHKSVRVRPALTSNDGAVIRQWTLADGGIAYKSIRDVQGDLDKGRLQTVLDDYVVGFQSSDVLTTGLQFVFPSRRYMPRHVEAFVEFFRTRLS